MEDIKDYLDKLHKENWERLMKNPPSFLDDIGEEITTEKMENKLWEQLK